MARRAAYAIDAVGRVVGHAFTGGNAVTRATLWQDGSVFDLGTLGGADSQAYDLNDAGQVVGFAETDAGAHRAFRFDVDATGPRAPMASETAIKILEAVPAQPGYQPTPSIRPEHVRGAAVGGGGVAIILALLSLLAWALGAPIP